MRQSHPDRPASTRSRVASRVPRSLRDAARPERVLLAVKTAVAVTAAWLIAPLMPGAVDDYPYYAPLGALISMYPTLMNSLRSSLQTLLGLAAGVGLAALVSLTVGPSVWAIAAAAALGVIISGTGWFGAGQEYIPMAALLVLIIGGGDAEDYSLGYVVQTGVGIAVGLVVHLVVPPAPLVGKARARLDAFQRTLAGHLHDIGDAVTESWPPENEGWARDARELAETSRTLRTALADADESRRANPRAWLRRIDTSPEHARLEMLDDVGHQIRDISGCIGDTIWSRGPAYDLDPALVAPLADACHAVAAALDPDRDPDQDAADRAEAERRVELLIRAVRERTLGARQVTGPGVLSAMHLHRILTLLAPAD